MNASNGRLDLLFNNAGAGGARGPIDEVEPADWDRTMALLLTSVALGTRYAAPLMAGRPGAAIVNTASVAALASGFAPTAYSVAKAGVLHLTKISAADLARAWVAARAPGTHVVATPVPGRMSSAVRDGAAVPTRGARGRRTYAEHLGA